MPNISSDDQPGTNYLPEPSPQAIRRQRGGWLTNFRTWILGDHIKDLSEETNHMPKVAYLLTAIQSVAVVLALGHTELIQMLSPSVPLSTHIIDGVALLILIGTVIIADYAAIRSLERVSTLRRNRSIMLYEHAIFIAFLFALEGTTLGIVVAALDENPAGLVSNNGVSVVPTSGIFFVIQVGLRSLLFVWTMLQLFVISQPLPVQFDTLQRRAMKLFGGLATEAIETIDTTQVNLGEIFRSFAATTKRPPRRRTRWNGWLISREQELEDRETKQQDAIIEALEGLSRNRRQEIQQMQVTIQELHAKVRAGEDALIVQAEQAEETLEDAVIKEVALHLVYFIHNRTFPERLIEKAPELAEIGPGTTGKFSRVGPGQLPMKNNTTSKAAAWRRFLTEDMRIAPTNAPKGSRGVWLTAKDVAVLTESRVQGDAATALIKRIGKGAKSGVAGVAMFEPVMSELAQRNLLSERAKNWWDTSGYGAIVESDNMTPAVQSADEDHEGEEEQEEQEDSGPTPIVRYRQSS